MTDKDTGADKTVLITIVVAAILLALGMYMGASRDADMRKHLIHESNTPITIEQGESKR